MLVTDLPTLPHHQYPDVNSLRQEVRRAKDYAAMYPNSAAAITAWFTAVGGGTVVPSTSAVVANAAAVNVVNSAGADAHAAVANVAASVVTGIQLPATVALVDNADVVVIQNSAGTVVGASGAATVAAGVQSAVKLPATSAVVVNAVKQSGVTITGTGTFFTPTIVAGVLTGGVLSAS